MLVEVGPFGGELPRLAPEHLPAGAVTGAQRALDCKLYSGDLIPVAQSRSGPFAGLDAPTEILGLYGAAGSDVSDIRWLAWDGASVDAVVAPSEAAGPEDRRVYWTDGVQPRWTTYRDAGGGGGEPDASFPLLFPSSLDKPTRVEYMPDPGAPTGDEVARAYVYTLVNTRGWESAPSLPSDSVDARDGVRVDVTVPAVAGAAANRWTKLRLYRVVVGDETATYRQVGGDHALGAGATVIEDTTPASALGPALATLAYSLLPANAQGLTLAHNGIYAAFSRDVLFLSEPDAPWAWPVESRYDIPAPVVAIAATNNAIVVLTEGYPYLLAGDDLQSMAVSRIDVPYPCLARRSVVALGNAVISTRATRGS